MFATLAIKIVAPHSTERVVTFTAFYTITAYFYFCLTIALFFYGLHTCHRVMVRQASRIPRKLSRLFYYISSIWDLCRASQAHHKLKPGLWFCLFLPVISPLRPLAHGDKQNQLKRPCHVTEYILHTIVLSFMILYGRSTLSLKYSF